MFILRGRGYLVLVAFFIGFLGTELIGMLPFANSECIFIGGGLIAGFANAVLDHYFLPEETRVLVDKNTAERYEVKDKSAFFLISNHTYGQSSYLSSSSFCGRCITIKTLDSSWESFLFGR